MKKEWKIVQDHLERRGDFGSVINETEPLASKVFKGAISYATSVFVNRLFLGGSYQKTKNVKEIADCLQQLNNLIK